MEAGMVRELTYGDSSSRFDANVSEHYHVICEQCGKIEDFMYPTLVEVERKAEEETGYHVTGLRLELYGICDTCKID
ncbi:Peroxide-responsive repressor PerR [compost metagenome]